MSGYKPSVPVYGVIWLSLDGYCFCSGNVQGKPSSEFQRHTFIQPRLEGLKRALSYCIILAHWRATKLSGNKGANYAKKLIKLGSSRL